MNFGWSTELSLRSLPIVMGRWAYKVIFLLIILRVRRAAGVALVDVRAARDGGEPVEGGRTDRVIYV